MTLKIRHRDPDIVCYLGDLAKGLKCQACENQCRCACCIRAKGTRPINVKTKDKN